MQGVTWLDEKQVSELIGVSLSKLRIDRMKRIGLPFTKFSSRVVRYNLNDIMAFAEKNTIRPVI